MKNTIRTISLWFVPILFLLVFFFYPLGATFNLVIKEIVQDGLSAIKWARVLRPLGFTFFQAFLSTVLTLCLGLPAAFVFGRFTFPGKTLLRVLATIPFILPTVVVAASFNALLGPRGWANLLLMDIFNLSAPPLNVLNSLFAILIAHLFYNTTIVLRMVGSALEQLDPRLEEAARSLGASPFRAFWEVTFPLIKTPVLAAALLVFLFDFTSFGVILLLGGPSYTTLEVEIYTQALYMLNLPLSGVLSIIQLICTLVITIIYSRLNRQIVRGLSPRLKGESLRPAKTRFQRLMVIIILVTLVSLLVLPLTALTARSFTRLEADRGERGQIQRGFTLAYYQELFINRRGSIFYVPPIKAALNSLTYASETVLISLSLGLLAAYGLSSKTKFNRILDPLLMLPLGTSAVTLGLGFIIVFNKPPLDVRSFPLIIPFAHSLVALPFVVRTLQPAILSIPRSLQQAAAVLGASPWKVWREIDFPIISKAGIVAAIFSFTISLGEFGATSFLSRPEYPTLPVAIYRFLSQPGGLNYGQAMAMATLLMTVCGLSIYLLEKFNQSDNLF